MADKKISQLTALTTAAETDPVAVVDTGGAITKKITRKDFLKVQNVLDSTSIINPLSAYQGKLLEDNKMDDLVDDTTPQLGGDLESNAFDIKMADDDKVLLGTGADGEIYVTADDLYIKNVSQDKDIILGIDDGGVSKTITWDADVDKLKHSAGTFDFDDDILITTGNIFGSILTASSKLDVSVVGAVDASLYRNGNSSALAENRVQMAFGFNGTDTFKQWLLTEHNNTPINNSFNFFTSDGTSGGVYPTNAIFGLKIENGGIETPKLSLPSALSTLAAGDPIPITNSTRRVAGNGGAVTLTSTPTIADGIDGQEITIIGTSDTNTVTLQDESSLGGSGLQLAGGANFTLGQYDIIKLKYTTAEDKWMEISRSNN